MSDFDHQLRNIGLRNVAIEQNVGASIANERISGLNTENSELRERLEKSQRDAKEAKQQATYYKNLLSRPMLEIAEANADFKAAYEIQQLLLTDWMVSQRAFKELALDFGQQAGIPREDVLAAGAANKAKVLNNETKHGNNVKDSEFMSKRADKLRAKQTAQPAA